METSASVSEEWVNLEVDLENDDLPAHYDYVSDYSRRGESPTDALARLRNPDGFVMQNNKFQDGAIPNFYETIPTLQEMASYVVAVALWRRVISLKDPNHDTNSSPSFNFIHEDGKEEVEKLLLNLPVPRLIREIVEKYLERVQNEMNDWLRFYKHNLFAFKRGSGEGTVNICDLLFCIWLPNGKIDDKRSAVNMLSNSRLTEVHKFKIMGRYCLENEIKKISPKSFPSYFTKRIQFSKNALMYYWLCYVNGNLDKIPKKNDESVESMLISAFNVDTWSAIEYFWNRLNVNEQISKAEDLITRRPQFQKQLFSKMDESQKNHLLSKMPVEIAVNFWKQEGQERFTFLTWIYIRNFVDYEQFDKLIELCLNESLPHHDDKISYLVDIWNYAPDHLKNLSLQRKMYHMIINVHTSYYIRPCSNIEFLLAYLSYFNVETRKEIIFECAEVLVSRIEPSVIDPLIKLCLPNAKHVAKLKEYVLGSDLVLDCCCQLLLDNTLHELNEFLNYYCTDYNVRSEFCNKFLESFEIRGCPFYCLSKWIETIEFIDSNLLDTLPHQATRIKKRLAKSFAVFCCELWSNENQPEMNKMIDLVSQVLDTEEITEFKTRALERVQTRYQWSDFEEEVIGGFILWCCDNDVERAREFKKSLSVDGIFKYGFETMKWNRALEVEVDQETVFKIFEHLEKLLLWYFENAEDVKRYKLKRVFGYCDDGVSMFRRYSQMENDVFTRNTLPWFFDGDHEQIARFKEQFENDDVGGMI